MAGADVGEAQHHAIDDVVQCAVGLDARQIPGTRGAFYFNLAGDQRIEHGLQLGQQVDAVEAGLDVAQGAAEVAGDQRVELQHFAGEALDAQMVVEQQGADADVVEQVLDVVLQAAHLFEAAVQLGIHRNGFFVQGLQLLFRGFQLFVRRLQFFVGGLQFLVGRFEFFVGGLLFLDGGLQVLTRVGELALQVFDARGLHRRGGAFAPAPPRPGRGRRNILEADQQQAFGAVGCTLSGRQQAHAEAHDEAAMAAGAVIGQRHLAVQRRPALGRRGDGNAQLHLQAVAGHLDRIGGHRAGGRAQVAAGVAMHKQDVAARIGGDRGRRIGLQQQAVAQVGNAAAPGFGGDWRSGGCHGNVLRGGAPEQGQGERVGGCGLRGPVELPFAVQRDKQLGMMGDALRGRQEEHAAGLQRVVKAGDQAVLLFRLEVDHQVAATEQVELGKGRVLDHALHGEHDHLAQLFPDLVAAIRAFFAGEAAVQALGRQVLGDAGRIAAGAGGVDGLVVEVGGVDQHLEIPPGLVHQLAQQDGDGIGLLAAGATGDPDAEHVVLGLVGQERGQDFLLQGDKGPRVAKEAGDVDQQFLEQQLHFRRVPGEEARIYRHAVDAVLRHAPLDAAAQGAFLVQRKIVAGGLLDLLQDHVQAAHRGGRQDGRQAEAEGRLPGDLNQHGRHFFHGQDVRGVAGGNRALRHAVVSGGGRLLHHADAACALDRAQAQGSVAGGTGEDDADGALGLILGQRAQEAVDGKALAARQGRLGEVQHALVNAQLAVGWNHIDVVGSDRGLVQCLHHRHGGGTLQDFGQQAVVAGVEVRHQHEGHAGIGRAGAEEGLKGLQPAGGRANADDRKG